MTIGNVPTRDDAAVAFDPTERITGRTIVGVRRYTQSAGAVPE
ncbi:hypothetical protein ACIQWL_54595 [Streptomyces mirabilis]|nr:MULTISPECIES: hypothetical protein [Streptomyces]